MIGARDIAPSRAAWTKDEANLAGWEPKIMADSGKEQIGWWQSREVPSSAMPRT
jgi:hypothetical protein